MSNLRIQIARLIAWTTRHRRVLGLAFCLGAALLAASASARPGGGGSFGGGGGSHSGGGGSSDDDFILDILLFVLQICIDYPAVGIPMLIVFVVVIVVRAGLASTRKQNSTWTSSSDEDVATTPTPSRPRRSSLEDLRRFDPDFSLVLFEDFLYGLYAEVRYRQGRGQLPSLSAYLTPEAIAELGREDSRSVDTVVIGAMRYTAVEGLDPPGADILVSVEFEANFGTDADAVYSQDLWRLRRRRGVRSRPPEKTRVFHCPSCGAPQSAVVEGRCSHCEKSVATGEFDWVLDTQMNESREAHGPMLTGMAPDQGASQPTLVHPEASQRLAALRARDPLFDWGSFRERLQFIFNEFQTAWAARDLAAMRPFLSDLLFEEERYWVDAYRRQHLRNVTENARIARTQLARVVSDKYFDAITVRLFATGLDYTVDEDGKVISGSRRTERPYSEYWTLIRSAGVTGPAGTEKKCPSCGAPLKVNMAGTCAYCAAKVTAGNFDWVLSRIEQASAYTG